MAANYKVTVDFSKHTKLYETLAQCAWMENRPISLQVRQIVRLYLEGDAGFFMQAQKQHRKKEAGK